MCILIFLDVGMGGKVCRCRSFDEMIAMGLSSFVCKKS